MQSNGKFVRTSFSNSIRGRGRGAPRRRNKGLREMKHHVWAAESPSGPRDVVLVDEEIRVCGDSCTKSEGLELRKGPKTWCKRNERTRFCGSLCTKSEGLELRKRPKTWCKRNERTRFCGSLCTKSEGLVLRNGPKTWCKGNAETRVCGSLCTKSEAAERRTTDRRSLRLHRPSWDAHREGGALARDAVHVNRRVMDHQRVFYDGEA